MPRAVAPTNSQHIAWRLPRWGASWAFSAADTEDNTTGATRTVKPSLPSTACLSSAEAERANHDGEERAFEVWDLGRAKSGLDQLSYLDLGMAWKLGTHKRATNNCVVQDDGMRPCHFNFIRTVVLELPTSGTA